MLDQLDARPADSRLPPEVNPSGIVAVMPDRDISAALRREHLA